MDKNKRYDIPILEGDKGNYLCASCCNGYSYKKFNSKTCKVCTFNICDDCYECSQSDICPACIVEQFPYYDNIDKLLPACV